MKLIRFFSTDKCSKSLVLNIFGFQALRYLISKIIYQLKITLIREKEFKEFRKNGFDINPDFLENNFFKKIKNEFNTAILNHENSNILVNNIKQITVDINKLDPEKFPNICKLLEDYRIINFFKKNDLINNSKIFGRLERIEVIDDNIKDPQKDYHYDTFHNTFKTWIYISNVEKENGPLHFVPRSHKFSLKRLFKEWKNSIIFSLKYNKLNPVERDLQGSPRDGNNTNIKQILNDKAIKFDVKQNTMVRVNTHGLHRRGDAKKGEIRDCINIWTRENPFKIIFN